MLVENAFLQFAKLYTPMLTPNWEIENGSTNTSSPRCGKDAGSAHWCCAVTGEDSKHLLAFSALPVASYFDSKTTSFLLLVRHLFLVAMHLFLVAYCSMT